MSFTAFTVFNCIAPAVLGVFLCLLFVSFHKRSHVLHLPPGPLRLPLIENLFDLPSTTAWEKYREMAKRYGDILSLTIPGQTVIVINSLMVARELLEKRGQTWSDRPRIPLIHMMGVDEWNLGFTSCSVSDAHRAEKRIADFALRPSSLAQPVFQYIQRGTVHAMLKGFLDNPAQWTSHVDYMVAGTILSIAYGYNWKTKDEDLLVLSTTLSHILAKSIAPSNSIINVFPSLGFLPSWLPGMGAYRYIREARALGRQIRDEPVEHVIEQIRGDTAKPSIVRDFLVSQGFNGDPESLSASDRKHVANITATLYETAVDTTGIFIRNFILSLVLYPQAQSRAQSEVDRIIGTERLPDFADLSALPYVQAFYLELLRWRMISPMGIPHCTSVDDVYDGYFVPKGSMVFANAWAMLHDPLKYPNPEAFMPERFMTSDGKFKNDPDMTAAFGFGRRICSGRFFVANIIQFTMASILFAFNVTKAKDANGKEILVTGEYAIDSPSLSGPLPFKCAISPRTKQAGLLIDAAALAEAACVGSDVEAP